MYVYDQKHSLISKYMQRSDIVFFSYPVFIKYVIVAKIDPGCFRKNDRRHIFAGLCNGKVRDRRQSDIKPGENLHHRATTDHFCFRRNGVYFLLISENAIYGSTGVVITSGDNSYDRDVICSTINWLDHGLTGDDKLTCAGQFKEIMMVRRNT